MTAEGSSAPIPIEDLTKIANEACNNALPDTQRYDHENVGSWNSQIIVSTTTLLRLRMITMTVLTVFFLSQNTILKALIAATAPTEASKPPPYRFTVNSTIVQQGVIDESVAQGGALSNAGKRGMHSASGAFWDVNRDGMWTFKYAGAEERGMDVVVCVTWFAVV
ncbi:hypothetical protein N7461_000934 [Penicillium sp. DV-2018c]|nr:hypothetical protein N7461_000934 [Penicillium sp. DV-2018c]